MQIRVESADALKSLQDELAAQKAHAAGVTAQLEQQQAAAAGKEGQLNEEIQELKVQ